jgi:hypothetical protein
MVSNEKGASAPFFFEKADHGRLEVNARDHQTRGTKRYRVLVWYST